MGRSYLHRRLLEWRRPGPATSSPTPWRCRNFPAIVTVILITLKWPRLVYASLGYRLDNAILATR